jgi:4-carboxymuconolactone decarboxylase
MANPAAAPHLADFGDADIGPSIFAGLARRPRAPSTWAEGRQLAISIARQKRGDAMSRYREIAVAEMNAAQKRAHDQIVAGKRGRFGGPFQLLIRAPEICEHAAKLGEHLRWGTSLPDRLSELAIITTARFWRAQYEWHAHAPLAVKAGVPAAAVEAIRTGGSPHFQAADETLVHRLCSEIFRTQRLSDQSFSEAVAAFGEQGVVEIVALIGYYTLIGNTLNVFQVPLPAGETPPFPE